MFQKVPVSVIFLISKQLSYKARLWLHQAVVQLSINLSRIRVDQVLLKSTMWPADSRVALLQSSLFFRGHINPIGTLSRTRVALYQVLSLVLLSSKRPLAISNLILLLCRSLVEIRNYQLLRISIITRHVTLGFN